MLTSISRSISGPPSRLRRIGYVATIAALLLMVLTGCQPSVDETLRFGLRSSAITLDPRFATDATSSRINRLLYTSLTDFDAHDVPVPALATWTRLDSLHYRFTIRDDAPPFAGDRPLTAYDVEATYRSILDEATASPHRGPLANSIASVTAVDAGTVEFVLLKPDPLFPGLLVIGILPQDRIAAGHVFARDPIGNGPFRMVAWPEEGALTIERIDDGQRIEFVTVHDPTVRVLKLLNGEIDMVQGDLLPESIAWLATRDDVEVTIRDGTNFAYIGFNMEDAVVGDVRVRRAIAHAIDRTAIVREMMGGAAQPTSAILPGDHWAGAPELALIRHDPTEARRLLKEAGYPPDARLTITYKTSSDPFRVRLATVFQDQLAQVGIDIELRSYDWGTFYGDIKAGRFQMYSLAWVGIKLPDIFRYAMHSEAIPPSGANRGRLDHPQVDRLIEQAEAAGTLEAQATHYRALQHLLLEVFPYVPLWFEHQIYVARRDIGGYTVARDGNYDGLITVYREPIE